MQTEFQNWMPGAMLAALFVYVVSASAASAGSGPDSVLIHQHWRTHDDVSTTSVDHGAWAELLDQHILSGSDGVNRVRYAALVGGEKVKLDAYVAGLSAAKVTQLNRAEQMAFWINLYNAVTVKLVADHYPVKSIRKIMSGGFFTPGLWHRKIVTVEGRKLSLNDIEHGILRPIWNDNRIHYAVNCASIGCPNLAHDPYTGDTLEVMLDRAARNYVNDPRGAHIDTNGRLDVSRIYDWYDEDFGGTEAGIIAHLKKFAEPGLRARLAIVRKVDDYVYDWKLNDAALGHGLINVSNQK